MPKIINDSESGNEEEEEEEEEEEKEKEEKIKINNWKNNHIKCTDCVLFYDNVEEMSKHYYNIHDKNKIKEKNNKEKERKKSRKKEINIKFNQWTENRIGKKINHTQKNINTQKGEINKKELNIDEKEKIIDEEEEIKEKFKSDLDNVFKNKGLKIGKKMKEISIKRNIIIKI